MANLETIDLNCPEDAVTTTQPVQDGYSSPYTSVLNGVNDSFFNSILNLPKCLKGRIRGKCGDESDVSLEALELNIRNFPVPSMTIASSKVSHGVGNYSESSGKLEEFDDLTFSVKMDDKMINYNTIYQWLNMITSMGGGFQNGYASEYKTTFSVLSLDGYQCPIGAHTFSGVFPTSIGGYDLDSTSSNSDVYFDVTFSFDHMIFEINDQAGFGDLMEMEY